MTRAAFDREMAAITENISGRAVDDSLEKFLNEAYPADGETFAKIEASCHEAVAEGWMCGREAGGVKFGRVNKPGDATHDFSIDVVHMNDVKGPHHVHTTGEIGMIMPISDTAVFDGKGRGWYVYPPGSAHYPTVTGGEALVLYLLPGGRIEFTGR